MNVVQIIGVKELTDRLKALEGSYGSVSVAVGFQTNYAIYVHENLEAYHPVGMAKFLEEPARTLHGQFGKMVRELVGRGVTLRQALLFVGLRLQREAQELCPVDTGLLKNSAFTKDEVELLKEDIKNAQSRGQ